MIYEIRELKCDTKHGELQVSKVVRLLEPDESQLTDILPTESMGIMGELEANKMLAQYIKPGDTVRYHYPNRIVTQDYAQFMEDMQAQIEFEKDN